MRFGLVGTITYDVITSDEGERIEGLGGVLYQAAVLSGQGKKISLFTNTGKDLFPLVDKAVKKWPPIDTGGMNEVIGAGNQVSLHYPEEGERIEVLRSVVPPLDPDYLVSRAQDLDFLICVINSGFDVELKDWRKIVEKTECPVWLDIHSLPLSKNLGQPREYLPFPEWEEWAHGIHYLQANRTEVSCMLGEPNAPLTEKRIEKFFNKAFSLGLEAAFVTLGKDGVFAASPEERRILSSSTPERVVDTTGCGDVFCSGTAYKLAEGSSVFEAASFGLKLATHAVGITGIESTYRFIHRLASEDES
jgi:hypothetical protein